MTTVARQTRTLGSGLSRIGTPAIVGSTDAALADNRRWAKRRDSATLATICSNDIGDPLPCVVLDSSSTGARIKPHFARAARCQNLKDLPAHLTLFFTIDRVAIDCKIAWRRDGEVGLEFVSPARSIPKPHPNPTTAPKRQR